MCRRTPGRLSLNVRGRQSRKPGGVTQHLVQDHQALLAHARVVEDRYVNTAIASGRACLCGNATTKRGHRCMVYTQLAILHTALASLQDTVKPPLDGAQEFDPVALIDELWQAEWSDWLSHRCSLCKIECDLELMTDHLNTHHAELVQPAMQLFPQCSSKTPGCCKHCWLAEGVVDTCPLATLRDLSRRSDGSAIEEKPRQPLKRPKHEADMELPSTSDQLPKVVQLLATLALRHERQLQAMAVQDTFIIFLQPGSASIIPQIQQSTTQWKQAMERQETTQSLRLTLVMLLAQTLLDRMLKVAHAQKTPDHQRTWRMELLDVEAQGTENATHGENSDLHDQHAKPPRGTCRTSTRPTSGGEIQMSEGGGRRCQASEDSTLDAAGEHAVPEALRSPPDPRSVEPPIGEIETTHGQGESPGLQFSEGIKWPFPKDAVAGWLVAVRLGNDNVCYQNATIIAFPWTICQMVAPCWNDLGKGAEKLHCSDRKACG